MYKKLLAMVLVFVLALSMVACSTETKSEETTAKTTQEAKAPDTEAPAKAEAEKPGESGFVEIEIGEEQQIGPFNVAAVYFQPVDMIPAGKNPTKEESDMHLEADIHLQSDYAVKYGFGSGDNIWPAYLTVKYEVMDNAGKVVTEGSFMPMNADDGPHYGANIKKNIMTVGQYKLKLTIEPPTDYLLHVDDETGVPAKQEAENYFKVHTAEFDWNYTGEQLQNE